MARVEKTRQFERSLALLLVLSLPSVAHATHYYVATNGLNSASGSSLRPWRTIAHAVGRASAGDTIVVRAGVYREAVAVNRSGTTSRPITIRGLAGAVLESPDPNRSLSAFDVGAHVSNVRLQGFELRGGFAETVYLRPGARNIELSGLTIHSNRNGIWVAGAQRVTIRDSVLRNNFRTGVRMFGGARDVQIIDTRSENNNDGEGCDGDSDGFSADESCSNVYFENATAIGNSEDGFDVQATGASLLRVTAQRNQCSGLKLSAAAYVENAVVEGNRTGANVVASIGSQTIITYATFVDNDLGIRAVGGGYGLTLTDSIVSGPGKAIEYASGVALSEARNIFARPNLRERLIVQQTPTAQVLFSGDDINGAKWAHASGQGSGSVARDPALDANYAPTAGSYAVDRGAASVSVNIDRDGNPRPVGNGHDRGALERQSGAPQLRMRGGQVRSNDRGAGRLQLRADLQVAGRERFDFAAAGLRLVISGKLGTVGELELVPGGVATTTAGVYHATARRDGTVMRVVLMERPAGYEVSVRGRDLPTWRAPDGEITLDVTVGTRRACATTSLRGMQGGLVAP
jgi:nitrous oxidase accessory protein NosD